MFTNRHGKVGETSAHINRLMGGLYKLGQNDSVDPNDVKELITLISDNLASKKDKFVDAARAFLESIAEDGEVDKAERKALAQLSALLECPVSDEPVEGVDGLTYVVTGNFEVSGGKSTAEAMIEAAGGTIKNSVSKKVDYVVAGARGSSDYVYGGVEGIPKFGRKTTDALGLILKNEKCPAIVSEGALMAFLMGNKAALAVFKERAESFERQWQSVKVAPRSLDGLTAGQREAFDLVKSGANVYLSGLGGTGKSYILERIIDWAEGSGKNVITCAPTGIAALNVGGSTVHRVLGIRPKQTLAIKSSPFIADESAIPDCDLLILDEVSMCRMDLFDYLSTVLRKAAEMREKNGRRPCQLVVVGDFCQLPPVVTKEERPVLEAMYGKSIGEGYPFLGNEWAGWDFARIELTEAVRQRDADFVAALNACRVGDTAGLRWIEEHCATEPDPDAIVLCGRNDQADLENKRRLSKISCETTWYNGTLSGAVVDSDMPTLRNLPLKPGARVMNLVNVDERERMNGSLGTVVKCDVDRVVVDFDGLGRSVVTPNKWEVTKPSVVDGKTRNEVVGTFEQIPLKLAWAITIHKAQGQTFERATVVPDCWDAGQLYTALSRLASVGGLYITGKPIRDDALVTSPDVISFNNLRS